MKRLEMWVEPCCGGLSALSQENVLYYFALSSLMALQGVLGSLEGRGAGQAARKLPGESWLVQAWVHIQEL